MSSHRPGALGLLTDFDPVAMIEAETEALAAAAQGHLDARVEHCPEWTVADLVWHLREVQASWCAIVRDRVRHVDSLEQPDRPANDRLVTELRSGVVELAAALRSADPAEPVFTWSSRQDAGWVLRHQVQEAAVHRWDGENAVGTARPLDPAAAADGVEEYLTYTLPFRNDEAPPAGGSLLLESTDTAHRWHLVEGAGQVATFTRSADGADHVGGVDRSTDVTLRGTASDLLLWLYRRVPSSELLAAGDASVAERWALRGTND